jgi:UTP--glucose-1-phosphate uridylyltransferase
VGERLVRVRQMVEKPSPEKAPSRLGVAGRYVLTPSVFECIRNQPRGSGGEIQLTDGIAQLIETEGVHAYLYEGKRYDCGSKDGFLEASVEFALKHPEVGPGFRDYLRKLDLGA